MKRKLIFPVVFFLLGFISPTKAQVINSDVTLSTQASVDAFNATQVNGVITITGATITNLNGLSELTKCNSLIVATNPSLTSIIGLANLTEVVNNLTIRNNSSLTNLVGFSSLTTVGNINTDALNIDNNSSLQNVDGFLSLTFATKLIISNNSVLANLDGLSTLVSVEHFFTIMNNPHLASLGLTNFTGVTSSSGNFTIDNNDALTNVDGLSSVDYLAGLIIRNNSALANLDGLSHLTQIQYGGLTIENNSALININGLSHVIYDFGDLKIINNLSLPNLDGLSSIGSLNNIDARHNLEIKNNASLTNIDGLSSFVGIADGDLTIQGNPVLANIDGLSKLKLVGEAVLIDQNPNITNVDGLTSLEKVHSLAITHNNSLTNLDGLSSLDVVITSLVIRFNSALTDFCGLSHLFNSGEIGGTVTIKDNGANTVFITAPPDITLNNDPNLCSKDISAVVPTVATVTGCLNPAAPSRSDYPPGNIFPVGTTNITWSVTDAAGNTATAIQHVIISDNQAPTIIGPTDVTVSCAANAPAIDVSTVRASDNCSGVIVSHVSDDTTNKTCANRFTITRIYRATDGSGNTADAIQTITVNDNTPPQITGLSVSQSSLWPADHKMRDITVNYTFSDNCVSNPTFSLGISSNEPVNGVADGDTDPDWEVIDAHHIQLRSERASNGTGRIYTITVTVDDGCNSPVTSSTEVRVAHNITAPLTGKPFKFGSIVDFAGEFWDKAGNKHSAKWLIDGNSSIKAAVTEPSITKNGKVTGSYKFLNAGVYKLQMNITDQAGVTSYTNTNGDLEEIIVIYDPNGGYAYGGGYFASPAGALTSNPTAKGNVSYGFAVNYYKGATNPKGETQFEFKLGDIEFNAVNFDYLAISEAKAQFKGSGRITGDQSGYAFIMTVTDGQLDGTGIDKVRVKIYNKNTGAVVYDSQPGASDAANPVTPVGTNSSVTISSNAANTITTRADPEGQTNMTTNSFVVNAYPNPTKSNFSLNVNSTNRTDQIKMQVIDVYGRIIETRIIASNQNISFGQLYKPGAYYIRIINGKEERQLKLVKLTD